MALAHTCKSLHLALSGWRRRSWRVLQCGPNAKGSAGSVCISRLDDVFGLEDAVESMYVDYLCESRLQRVVTLPRLKSLVVEGGGSALQSLRLFPMKRLVRFSVGGRHAMDSEDVMTVSRILNQTEHLRELEIRSSNLSVATGRPSVEALCALQLGILNVVEQGLEELKVCGPIRSHLAPPGVRWHRSFLTHVLEKGCLGLKRLEFEFVTPPMLDSVRASSVLTSDAWKEKSQLDHLHIGHQGSEVGRLYPLHFAGLFAAIGTSISSCSLQAVVDADSMAEVLQRTCPNLVHLNLVILPPAAAGASALQWTGHVASGDQIAAYPLSDTGVHHLQNIKTLQSLSVLTTRKKWTSKAQTALQQAIPQTSLNAIIQ